MRRGAPLLMLVVLACGCRSSAVRRGAEIPVEQTPQGKAITAREKETLLALARESVPGRRVRSILLHSWHHPNDLPVATVRFEPVELDAERYEFVTLTALNRNWHEEWDENPPTAVSPPEVCWYLDEGSRHRVVKHRFRYRSKPIFLAVPEENTHRDIEEIVRIFERGGAVDENGKTSDFLTDRTYAIRRYAEGGSVFVEVFFSQNLSGGTYTFVLVGVTLVLKKRLLWVS
jgi:hypothetical protein